MIDFLEEEAEALPGSFSQYDMKVIYPALSKMGPGDVYLEIGVQYGRSLKFARKHSQGLIYGIDPLENPPLKSPRVKGVIFIRQYSNDAVKEWELPITVLFIDGDHSYQGCKDDWLNFSPFVKKGGTVFFHDCDETSGGVVKLFKEIDPKVWEKKLYKAVGFNTSMASARRLK